MDQWITRIKKGGKMILFTQYFTIKMTESIDSLPEKYRLLEAFIESAFYQVRCLLSREVVENEPLLDDYIALMIVAMISQSVDFKISKTNIDLVENLSPEVTQIIEDFKAAITKELKESLQDSSTVVE